MDLTTHRYLENSDRARDAMVGGTTVGLGQFGGDNHSETVVLNAHYLFCRDLLQDSFYKMTGIQSTLAGAHASVHYDSRDVQIYSTPRGIDFASYVRPDTREPTYHFVTNDDGSRLTMTPRIAAAE